MAESLQSSSLDHDIQMERQLSCSVCLDLFTDPVLLPCLHSLCRACVDSLSTRGEEVLETIKCPECNGTAEIGPEGHMTLKRNFPLSSLVSIYARSASKRARKSAMHNAAPPKDLVSDKTGNLPNSEQPQDASAQSETVTNPNEPGNTLPYEPEHAIQLDDNVATGIGTNQGNMDIIPQENVVVQDMDLIAFEDPMPNNNNEGELRGPSVERSCSTCDVANSRKADVHCETCCISFCSYCLNMYHPEGMGHRVVQIEVEQPTQSEPRDNVLQCPICDPSNPRPPIARCLECEMAFCEQCLNNFHPSSKTIPGHTLVDIVHKEAGIGTGTGTGTGSGSTPGGATGGSLPAAISPAARAPPAIKKKRAPPPPPPPRATEATAHAITQVVAGGTPDSTGGAVGGGPTLHRGSSARSSRTSVDSIGSQVDIGGLAHLAVRSKCAQCVDSSPRDSDYKCLDCSVLLCGECAHTHELAKANHTIVDIRWNTQDKRTAASNTTRKEPVNVQLKLVELMNIRAEAMSELLNVLEARRQFLEGNGM